MKKTYLNSYHEFVQKELKELKLNDENSVVNELRKGSYDMLHQILEAGKNQQE